MSFSEPAHTIARWSVVGMEGMWAKMFDPPKESPTTPDLVPPTNPVPEVLAAAGFQTPPDIPHTVVLDLMHGVRLETWDNRGDGMEFYLFRNQDAIADIRDEFPSATLRLPQGVVFHCETDGHGPPPHTIHWHGLEPTPHNDGVGHCSFEIGHYVYQLQPQFIGTYFAHCHRNTMQHFEFGLYFLMLVEPKDAYFATMYNPAIPIGHCRDGRRRTAANLSAFPQFPDFNPAAISDADPWRGVASLKFNSHPHAQTVAYDVEALWVLDDRDSAWSDLGNNARATYPRHGSRPGFDDHFNYNGDDGPAAPGDFFAFNDFNADYWYVTGVPVPCYKGGSAAIPAGIEVPAALNSGVAGSQVSIRGLVGQTILVRCLDAAYNSAEVTFPVDVVIIAWDGRALGVAPFGYNHPYLVKAGTPIDMTTARRFDALIQVNAPLNAHATVKFINSRGQLPGEAQEVVCTALIPIEITASYKIEASAGNHGMVTPLGTSRVAPGAGKSYNFTPDPGYKVASVWVNSIPVTRATSYTFSNVTANQRIRTTFTLSHLPTGTILINGGALETASLNVTLALSAAAAGAGQSVTEMQFSQDGTQYLPFEPYATTRNVTLTPGDGLKRIWVRFKDSAGNVSDPISDSIILNTVLPAGSIVINGGAGFTNSQTVTLKLAATTTSGRITQMQFSMDGTTYDPLEPYATTKKATLLPGDGVKRIYVRFKDSSGKVSLPVFASITLSTALPTGTIAINGGASFTKSQTVTVTLAASSAVGSITQMQFSKDGTKYFLFEPYVTTRNVSLLPGNGVTTTLHVRFMDSAGNVSEPVSASITLDTAPPTGSIAFPAGNTTSSATATLALSASDASGVTHMQFSKNGSAYSSWEPFVETSTVTLTAGLNTVTVRFRDAAGNVSLPMSATITRN